MAKVPVINRVRHTLMNHQQQYMDWVNSSRHKHIPCIMEMRCGKNIANIRLIQQWTPDEKECYPILVICPSAVIEAWEEELILEGEYFVVLQGKTQKKRGELAVNEGFGKPGRNWLLINFESMIYSPELTQLPWFITIIDESVFIKNPKAKITKICTHAKSFAEVDHRFILSGLPNPEGDLDLFQQFYYLDREFMGCKNYYEYRNKYFYLAWNGWRPKKGMAKLIKDYVHNRSFVLTRQQAGIGSKKIREVRTVKMNSEQRKIYQTAEEDFIGLVSGKEIETDNVTTQRIWLARICGGCNAEAKFTWNPKANELLSLLKGELSREPVVVWFRFDAEIMAISNLLTKNNIPHKTLTGRDTRIEKKEKQNWFRTSPFSGRVMLVQQLKVAEHGVNMSSASTAIYYSFCFSGQTIAQTEDRIVDPKKEEPLLYLYLVMEDTVDVDTVEAIRNKVRDARTFMRIMKQSLLRRSNGKRPRI